METTTKTFNARHEIENVIVQEARRLWEDILHVAETKGVDTIASILELEVSSVGRKRVTSRSTSVVSNLLDDLKDGIVIRAYSTIVAHTGKSDKQIVSALKHEGNNSIASL